ncbi:MAG TPA: bifunctional 2-C-methyl-D-erythritol 4-phosphate cytidylyltransferase/2-C-methyl-D-erythritol 2,4-cyclodiphosphate synthase [Caulobacteraceae bacterium]|jgi:2-C-methyl-D-erythritol 4-phosphate cytidylyltransferase/2-C-methyl-D-erythritol 2,4-cyclodiphosphate synthase|nr:bifunctional 2-C-methyl-D-erythritol 4-phosphate cytidylyltransferase/2-C-methyl-D-erythritol 2,4-cyclodiphosphate synthase [Caulobacteraceae bacterium]
MRFSAVIVAAGASSRAGDGPRKPWRQVAGRAVVRWSAQALLLAGAAPVVLVVAEGDQANAAEALDGLDGWTAVAGGATRALSVQEGLKALQGQPDDLPVLIHDAARPFVVEAHVAALLDALAEADGALPALPMADTLKRADPAAGVITTPREGLHRAQTPQAFRLGVLRRAYAAWPADAGEPTDDAQVVEQAGGRVALVAGDPMLMKLTYPEDFAMAERLVQPVLITRVGQGFDAHRFGPGDGVTLCGVRIAHDHSLIGHSDADAGLHALTDALLGAIGDGDIGLHFPPSDPRWKGADSGVFMRHAVSLLRARGGQLVNVDLTLICERPKLSPHRQAMRESLAAILELPVDRISVKATTTETMGFTGREEGLAAQALAVVQVPA